MSVVHKRPTEHWLVDWNIPADVVVEIHMSREATEKLVAAATELIQQAAKQESANALFDDSTPIEKPENPGQAMFALLAYALAVKGDPDA